MQALKALVIGMGILIIAGMAILVYGLSSKFGSNMAAKDTPQDGRHDMMRDMMHDTAHGTAAAFGTIRAALPAGASVESAQMQDGKIMVFLAMPDGGVQLMVFRLSDGRQTGTIELQPSR
ncbi:MAG: hypothetical protein GEU87_12310 [Alphaproteobacteria bacterium]|nr:hypothetical protein [Alphaproteobacteria bacterium]